MRRAIMNKSEAAEHLKVFEELIPAYIACMDDLSTAGNEENTAIAERAENVIQAFDLRSWKKLSASFRTMWCVNVLSPSTSTSF